VGFLTQPRREAAVILGGRHRSVNKEGVERRHERDGDVLRHAEFCSSECLARGGDSYEGNSQSGHIIDHIGGGRIN